MPCKRQTVKLIIFEGTRWDGVGRGAVSAVRAYPWISIFTEQEKLNQIKKQQFFYYEINDVYSTCLKSYNYPMLNDSIAINLI